MDINEKFKYKWDYEANDVEFRDDQLRAEINDNSNTKKVFNFKPIDGLVKMSETTIHLYKGGDLAEIRTYHNPPTNKPWDYKPRFSHLNTYKNGILDDHTVEAYDILGNKIREVGIENQVYHGPIKTFWENGKLRCEGNYIDEKFDGSFKYYDINGNQIFENNFIKGIPDIKIYNEEDFKDIDEITHYQNKKFTGQMCFMYEHYGSGHLVSLQKITNYINGKREGEEIQFDSSSGFIEIKSFYQNDELEGEKKFYTKQNVLEINPDFIHYVSMIEIYENGKFISRKHLDLSVKL